MSASRAKVRPGSKDWSRAIAHWQRLIKESIDRLFIELFDGKVALTHPYPVPIARMKFVLPMWPVSQPAPQSRKPCRRDSGSGRFSPVRRDSACGLRNGYRDPAQLGVDRWLAMCAAWQQFPGSLCVVDAGTAVTIDVVAADGAHSGGLILPGVCLDGNRAATGNR